MAERQWYFVEDGSRQGPLAESALAGLVRSGRVAGDTLVWSEGMQDWRPMADSPVAGMLALGDSLGQVSVPPVVPAGMPSAGSPGPGWMGTAGPGRPMGFFEAIASCFGKYVQFSGRASRSEYWYFHLFYFLAAVVANLVSASSYRMGGEPEILPMILSLIMFLPSLSVLVRRLHDTDRSGWWFWIGLIPVIGAIVLLVFMCLPPTPGRNRFG